MRDVHPERVGLRGLFFTRCFWRADAYRTDRQQDMEASREHAIATDSGLSQEAPDHVTEK